jgi:electron transport complex protein RnfD
MRDVCVALIPALGFSVWYFGRQALTVIIVCVLSSVAAEYLYQRHAKKPVRVNDWSAVVTGLLLAMNLPPTAPWWMCAIGSAIAIILIKQIFGGIGQNFLNPALGARTILMISWATLMTATVVGRGSGEALDAVSQATSVDALTQATPLALSLVNSRSPYTASQLFLGTVPGMLGETSKLALLIGGAYLLVRRVITWHIPVTFILTVFVLFLIQTGTVWEDGSSQSALYQTLSGGLILSAFFMATDYVTSPITPLGKAIMGVGCGLILWVIRAFNPSYPEGCSFAILFMNLLTPLINRAFRPIWFGETKAGEVKGGA